MKMLGFREAYTGVAVLLSVTLTGCSDDSSLGSHDGNDGQDSTSAASDSGAMGSSSSSDSGSTGSSSGDSFGASATSDGSSSSGTSFHQRKNTEPSGYEALKRQGDSEQDETEERLVFPRQRSCQQEAERRRAKHGDDDRDKPDRLRVRGFFSSELYC
jgi:hypothetical protein